MITQASILGGEDLADRMECIEALDMQAFYWRPRLTTYTRSERGGVGALHAISARGEVFMTGSIYRIDRADLRRQSSDKTRTPSLLR
jgi:hypothetical protein